MTISTIEDIELRLLSENLETQVTALGQAARVIKQIVKTAVQGLNTTQKPDIFGDRLLAIGPVIVPELEEFVSKAEPGERRTVASLLLLHFGSMNGVHDAIEEMKTGSDYQFLAANKLATVNADGIADLILERLAILANSPTLKSDDAPKFAAFLSALQKIRVPIPEQIREALINPKVPREISEMFRDGAINLSPADRKPPSQEGQLPT